MRQCYECKKWYELEDFTPHLICNYCSHERYFRNLAIANILRLYGLGFGEYCQELLEIETTRAKTRFLLRGNESNYIKYKSGNMITNVTNSTELRQALNENLHAILTKKRKLLVAKEVNNTLGKILIDVKMELMQNALSGNRDQISWFHKTAEQIGNEYGVAPRFKNAV